MITPIGCAAWSHLRWMSVSVVELMPMPILMDENSLNCLSVVCVEN